MLKHLLLIILSLGVCINLAYIYILSQKRKKIKFEVEQDFIHNRRQELENELQQLFNDKRSILYDEHSKLIAQYEAETKLYEQETRAAERQRNGVIKYEQEVIQSQLDLYRTTESAKIENDLKTKQLAAQHNFEELMNALLQEYNTKKQEIDGELACALQVLDDFKAKQDIINQALLREKEIKEKETFYKIQLSDQDKSDLQLLKEVEAKFFNREIFHRAAYDCYIKKPLLEMIKRVLNGRAPSGIYKITYIPTGEAYIGKSTDVAKRWTEHAKSVFGVGTIAHALVHTRMARDGIWNFTWELLEEVPKDKLSEREKYWIEFYGTKEIGMNEKGG